MSTSRETASPAAPKLARPRQWQGFEQRPWPSRDKQKVTILYSFLERRKSHLLRAYFDRHGYRYEDLGDHVKEDVRWGREFGNRMECNPMYFTCGAVLRRLFEIMEEEGLTKEEVVDRYVFLCGGGQCGPCRYGMYPQEYAKALNDAGFTGFRTIIFSSGFTNEVEQPDQAFRCDLPFRFDMAVALVLADLLHVAECALRPRALDKAAAMRAIDEAEEALYQAFASRWRLFEIPRTLRAAGDRLAALPRRTDPLPLIFVTGEFFANLAHNEASYDLRRFIADEGCEVLPGLFSNRVVYDYWRQNKVFSRTLLFGPGARARLDAIASLVTGASRSAVIKILYGACRRAMRPERFGGRPALHDFDHLAELGGPYYHPEIFGGEGNLEIAEALHYADVVDGFISTKPFGCLSSSGVSDGVQAKVLSLHPDLNFLSIETSGDNEASILSRVSMLLFKAKQRALRRLHPETKDATAAPAEASVSGRAEDEGSRPAGDGERTRAAAAASRAADPAPMRSASRASIA
jgi:predicted nucleotide-binding protein (sugar kinase/HSP70/actin superfamily)